MVDFRDLFSGRLPPTDYFRVYYDIVPRNGLSPEEAIKNILLITTQRTITRAGIEPPIDKLGYVLRYPRFVDDRGWIGVDIALPPEVCRAEEGLSHLLLVLTAAVEYEYADRFWVRGVHLPPQFLAHYDGPAFGVDGVRQVLGVERRPPLGVIVKPRWGGVRERTMAVCQAALEGGADFLVDDLLMGKPAGSMDFRSRVEDFVGLCRSVESLTGQRKTYWVNVAGTPLNAYEDAQYAADAGVGGIVIDAFTMGFGFLEELTAIVGDRVPVITTNMGSGVASRVPLMTSPREQGDKESRVAGVDEAVFALLSRVGGADGVHVGTSGSECFDVDWQDSIETLYSELGPFKPSFRVAEGDIDIHSLWTNVDMLGRDPTRRGQGDVIVEATNAILGYRRTPAGPTDPREGARLFRLVLDTIWEADTKVEADRELERVANQRGHADLKAYLRKERYFRLGQDQ